MQIINQDIKWLRKGHPLSLLLSHKDSDMLFAGLSTIVVDEVHAFANGKRGDLLALCMARLQRYAPTLRRVAPGRTLALK